MKITKEKADHILNQYRYHIWAHDQLLDHLKGLPDSVIHKELQSVFPNISTAIIHVYFTEVIWLKVIKGEMFEEIEEYTNRSRMTEEHAQKQLEEIEVLYKKLQDRYKQLFKKNPDLTKKILVQHPKFGKINISVYELLVHLINHATYHRGNITAMLRQLGYKGTPTDYFLYLIMNNK